MKTFVPFSGGLDSTYLLWKLLSQTTDEITALYVDVKSTDPYILTKYDIRSFSLYEGSTERMNNVNNVVSWLKENVRNFNFVIEPMNTQFLVRDINNPNSTASYFTRWAAPKLNDGTLDRICLAHEWDNDGYGNGGTVGLNRRPGSWVAHDIFPAVATRGRLEFTLLDMDYNQAYALSEMPNDLVGLVRYPLSPDPAKNAKTSWYKRMLSDGKTPKDAGDIAKANCTLPNNRWISMRSWIVGEQPTSTNTWDMPTWPTSIDLP